MKKRIIIYIVFTILFYLLSIISKIYKIEIALYISLILSAIFGLLTIIDFVKIILLKKQKTTNN